MREAALKLLSVRQRSVMELRQRLLQKNYSAEDTESCLATLKAQRLLDDKMFAEAWAGRGARKLIGRNRLRQELQAKGVVREVIQGAVGISSDLEERAHALKVARQKWKTLSKVPVESGRRRLYGTLTRRGFESSVIRSVVQLVTKGGNDDDERD